MTVQSPAFLLRVANALIEEVERKTDSVLEAVRTLERREGFMESLKGALAAGALVGELERNLKLAIQLADRAAQMDPNVKEGELTPSVVRARALFQQGVIAMGQRRFKEAVRFFEESLKQTPTQSTYLNMAYCFLQMKGLFTDRTSDAIMALERCVELDPTSELAVLAGKELARLGRL